MQNLPSASDEPFEAEARTLRDRARCTAQMLAKHGHRRRRAYYLLRSINVLSGVVLVSITFVPPLREVVGVVGLNTAVAVAGAVLIGDVIVPLLIGGPSADIFMIYAFYSDSYATQLDQILMENPSSERERHYRRGRLQELLRHLRLNNDDLRIRFPPHTLPQEGADAA